MFNDSKFDNIINTHKTMQFAFLTEYGSEVFKSQLLERDYQDATLLFIGANAKEFDIDATLNILNKKNNFFDIHKFYSYWLAKGKIYNEVTWDFYKLFAKLIGRIESKFVIISHKRRLIDYKKFGGNSLDTVLFCDFIELFIYPVYQEFKFFDKSPEMYNKYLDYAIATGDIIEQYNVTTIQYLQGPNNRLEKIIH